MPTPNWNMVPVRGHYVNSDGSPTQGRVVFTPKVSRLVDAEALRIIIGSSTSVTLDADGKFEIMLPASDDPDITPTGFTWQVRENFTGGSNYSIETPLSMAAEGVDLALVAPVAPSPGEGVVSVSRAEFDTLWTKVADFETQVEGVVDAVAADRTAFASEMEAIRDAAQDAASTATDAADLARDISNIDTSDDAIEAALQLPASKSVAELDRRYSTAADAFALDRYHGLASAEQAASAGRSLADHADVDGFYEPWADTSAWQALDLQTIDGNAHWATTPTQPGPALSGIAVRKVVDVGTHRNIRVRGSINLVAGGTGGGFILGGIWFGDVNAPPQNGLHYNAFGIGFRENGDIPVYRNPGGAVINLGTAQPTGTYHYTVSADERGYSASLESADGLPLFRVFEANPIPRTGSITGAFVMCSDTRRPNGSSLGAVAARAATVTSSTRARVEVAPSFQVSEAPAGQKLNIMLPANYDSRRPVPLILHTHARGGDEHAPWFGGTTKTGSVTKALVAAGFAVAGNNQHGNNWGNQDSLDDIFETYRYFRDHYALGPVAIFAQSMGGASGLSAIAERRIPGIRAFYGIFPVSNLAAIFNNGAGNYAGDIRLAYGFSGTAPFAAATADYDPMLRPGKAYQGVPMRFHHAPTDTLVPKGEHTDLFVPKIAPYVPEASVVTTVGDHGHDSNFNPADAVAFFKRHMTAT